VRSELRVVCGFGKGPAGVVEARGARIPAPRRLRSGGAPPAEGDSARLGARVGARNAVTGPPSWITTGGPFGFGARNAVTGPPSWITTGGPFGPWTTSSFAEWTAIGVQSSTPELPKA
jgi:hypothetical protein